MNTQQTKITLADHEMKPSNAQPDTARPTPQDHIRDLMDAATRFEDRAKRAEAHADKLAEALRKIKAATHPTSSYHEIADRALAAYDRSAQQ